MLGGATSKPGDWTNGRKWGLYPKGYSNVARDNPNMYMCI